MEQLKAETGSRGLWNLFHPDPRFGTSQASATWPASRAERYLAVN
jgi:hypothetical protein